MKLAVEIRSVYGRELIYPVNERAHEFAKLIGVKAFTRGHIDVLKGMGYEVEVVVPSL